MPNWSKEEIRQLVEAMSANQHDKVTYFMNLYQQRTNIPLLKKLPHIFITVAEGIPQLFEYYIKTQHVDNDTIFNCLELAIASKRQKFIEAFFSSQYIKFNADYIFNTNKSVVTPTADISDFFETILTVALRYANISAECEDIFKLFLNLVKQGKININQTFNYETEHRSHFLRVSNETALKRAMQRNVKPHLVRLLLEYGADPYIKVDVNGAKCNVFEFIQSKANYQTIDITHAAEYIQILKEWKEAKEKGISNRDSSPEHSSSSGSNSPMSLGSVNNSPNGSPPRQSAIVGHSPTDSPVASRNGSPPNSPMQKSDSSSCGSTGSSPEKITSDARDHELRDMLAESDMSNAKSLYDTGKITFKCTCFECSSSDENVLQDILCLKGEKFVNLARYILDHTKYPADINIRNKNKKTCLHLLAARKFDIKNKPLDELKHLFLSYGDKYSIDVNAKDKDGNTPLHLASANGNADLVAELLKHNADYSIKNNEGLEPYEYAARECKDSQKKSAVLAAMPRGSIVVSTPLAARSTSASTPIAIHNASGASPSVTTSYVASRAGVFSGRQDSYSLPDSTPVLRTQPAQIGAMYVPPPLTHDQLPRPIKKPGQIIMPHAVITNATTHADNKKSNSSVVTNKIKSLLGK